MSALEFINAESAKAPLFFGVDVGGTNIKIGLVDDEGKTLAKRNILTHQERGPEDAMGRASDVLLQIQDDCHIPAQSVAAVGLATPGTMDVPAGMLLQPHNLRHWWNFPIRDHFQQVCGKPVAFANDANAAASGEHWVGTGRDFHSIVFFTLGTGVGCGIIIGDLSIDGEHSHGSECGHLIIDSSQTARLCGCGQRGHLEAYASANAVIQRTQEGLNEGQQSSISARLAAGEALTPLLVAEEAELDDRLALQIVMDTARYLGVGAVNLMHTIDPGAVIFGGAMNFGGRHTELGRRFLERIRHEVRMRAFPTITATTAIEFASLGGDAGYIGAAAIARAQYHARS